MSMLPQSPAPLSIEVVTRPRQADHWHDVLRGWVERMPPVLNYITPVLILRTVGPPRFEGARAPISTKTKEGRAIARMDRARGFTAVIVLRPLLTWL